MHIVTRTSRDSTVVNLTTVLSVRSRTGYIICLGNCPLVWKSQLQTGITALSTLEAEYIALSQCMHVLIPLHRILMETANRLQLPNSMVSTIHATVFEDNNGALSLTVNQRITNRTKHLLIKWHWFWHHVKTNRKPDGPVEVRGISTDHQRSDYLTKALNRILFGNNQFEIKVGDGVTTGCAGTTSHFYPCTPSSTYSSSFTYLHFISHISWAHAASKRES